MDHSALTTARQILTVLGIDLDQVRAEPRPLREVLDAYIADLATRATPTHCANVRARLRWLIDDLGVTHVHELQPHTLLLHRAARLKAGSSVRTANLVTDRLRAMLTWAVRVGLISSNPLASLPRLPENEATKRYRRRALSDAEIESLLAAARDDDLRTHRRVSQLPLWRALLETGARYGELVRVTWADVDFERALLTLRATNTKSRKERSIPLLPTLVAELRALQPEHVAVLGRAMRPSDLVFRSPEGCPWPAHSVNINRMLHRLLAAAEIDRLDARGLKFDVHACRHSLASRLARAGVPITHAQKLLGHATVEMTAKVYVHLGEEQMRAAIERIETGMPLAERARARSA
jgi:integrase